MLFRGVWYTAGLCSMGSDTPQDFVKRGIRPRRTLFCGVSDPTEQVYAIKCTQLCHCSVGSGYTVRLSSAGSDTPQDLVLRGLIPRRILFCGVSDPAGKLRPRRTRWKCFESLSFSLKGHFSKIICIYKLHYLGLIGSVFKVHSILKNLFLFRRVWYNKNENNFEIRISPRIWTRIQKCFRVWIRDPYEVDSWKKLGAKNLVLLYL